MSLGEAVRTTHINMKFRDVVIFNGKKFTVPQGIQRIDTRATHGWQVRYAGTKLFSDHTSDGSGAKDSLARAQAELARRIAKMPAPSLLQKRPSESKTSDLPVGVSGPIVRQRKGSRVRSCSFSVLLPRYGMSPRCSSVYIGTENTYTIERYHAALEKAVALRSAAEATYELAATKAKRAAAKVLTAGGPPPKANKSSKTVPIKAPKLARGATKKVATAVVKKAAKTAAKAATTGTRTATKTAAKTPAKTVTKTAAKAPRARVAA